MIQAINSQASVMIQAINIRAYILSTYHISTYGYIFQNKENKFIDPSMLLARHKAIDPADYLITYTPHFLNSIFTWFSGNNGFLVYK
jgi:hypothetical protein